MRESAPARPRRPCPQQRLQPRQPPRRATALRRKDRHARRPRACPPPTNGLAARARIEIDEPGPPSRTLSTARASPSAASASAPWNERARVSSRASPTNVPPPHAVPPTRVNVAPLPLLPSSSSAAAPPPPPLGGVALSTRSTLTPEPMLTSRNGKSGSRSARRRRRRSTHAADTCTVEGGARAIADRTRGAERKKRAECEVSARRSVADD